MLNVSSTPTLIPKSQKDLYDFLIVLKNHEELISPDIKDYKASEVECSFNLRGMLKLTLIFETKTESLIELKPKPGSGALIDATLYWKMEAKGDATEVTYGINANVNSFLAMTFKKTLQDVVDYQVAKLSEKYI